MDQYNMYGEQGKNIQLPLCDRILTTELAGDFTLPDYQPEIKRLLKIWASVLPASGYVGMGDAEFAGNVDYYVLYMGGDNEIYCAPITSDYVINVPFDGDDMIQNGDGSAAMAEVVADSVSGRVISPRKLNIKCRLKTHAHVCGELMGTGDPIADMDPSYTEKLMGNVSSSRIMRSVGPTMHLNDEIIPDMRGGELRVICADGKVLVSEVNCGTRDINCRGEVHVKLLMSRDNEEAPYSVTRKIPFYQAVPVEDVDMSCSAYAKGTVSELSVTVEEGRIGIDCGIILEASAQKNQDITYLKDTYSTKCLTECEYKNVKVQNAQGTFCGNFTLGESMSLEECGIAASASAIDTYGSAFIDEYKFEKGKCIIVGRAKFGVLLLSDGDYSSTELEFPFKYETDANSDILGCEATASVISCRSRIDGERVGIDAEISLGGRMWGESEISMLSAVHFREAVSERRGEYKICYPSPDDTLWSVAKKYCAKAERLAYENQIKKDTEYDDPKSLEGIQYIVV